MTMKMRGLVALTASCLWIVACEFATAPPELTNAGPGPVVSAAAVADEGVTREDGTPPIPDLPTVDLNLAVEGQVVPGGPIRIRVTAEGRRAVSGGTLELFLPEVESGHRSGFDRHFRFSVGEVLPATETWQLGAIGRGGERTLSSSVTVPTAGLYRVIAKVQTSEEVEGHESNGYLIERWLLVAESGGRLMETFDPAA
ncbi:MAG: hypothetical protein RLN75_07175, partial [Longimicrobiales bacterium]